MPVKKKGRSSKPGTFTHEKRAEFLALYSTGMTVAQCSRKIGISVVTIFNHVRADEEFGEAYRRAVESNTDVLEDLLHTMARSGNVAALFGTLKSRRPEKWRDNFKVEHGGSIAVTTAESLAAARQRAQQRGQDAEARH